MLLDLYEEVDKNDWKSQINNKDYVQSVCLPDGSPVVMIKGEATVKAAV